MPGPDTEVDSLGRGADAAPPGDPDLGQWPGLAFTRKIASIANYMFIVHETVQNTGIAAVSLMPYGLISRSGTPPVSGYYMLYEGLIGYLDGALQEVK